MRDYWAAWGEILAVAEEAFHLMVDVMLKPILLPAAAVLAFAGWFIGECILLTEGAYGQAAAVFVVSLVLGLLVGGHLAARAIMREKERER